MSPRIVTAPDERRASMRSCIGVRSWASSTIRWPRARSGPSRRARASSSSARSASLQPRPRLDRRSACSSASRMPSAAAASCSGLVSRRRTSWSGFGRGQSAFKRPVQESAAPQRRLDVVEGVVGRAAEAGCVAVVEGAHELHAQALATGGVVGRLCLRLPDQRLTSSGDSRSSTPSRRIGEQLLRRPRQRPDGGGDHLRQPGAALQASDLRCSSGRTASIPSTSSSTARCSTRSSPSIGRTCEM